MQSRDNGKNSLSETFSDLPNPVIQKLLEPARLKDWASLDSSSKGIVAPILKETQAKEKASDPIKSIGTISPNPPLDLLLDNQAMVKNLKSGNGSWIFRLTQIIAIQEIIKIGGNVSQSILSDLVEIFLEEERSQGIRLALKSTIIEAIKAGKVLSPAIEAKLKNALINAKGSYAADLMIEMLKTGYYKLEDSYIKTIETNLSSENPPILNYNLSEILCYVAKKGFVFSEKTIMQLISLACENRKDYLWDEALEALNGIKLTPYFHLIKIDIPKDRLIRIFKNTSTHDILFNLGLGQLLINKSQVVEILIDRFTKNNSSLVLLCDSISYWEDNQHKNIPLPPDLIEKLKAEIFYQTGKERHLEEFYERHRHGHCAFI